MAKLTKIQKRTITSALNSIQRAIAYIEKPNIVIAHEQELNILVPQGPQDFRARESHRSQDYKGVEDKEWTIDFIKELVPVSKTRGSDLVSIYTAQTTLQNMLNEDGK